MICFFINDGKSLTVKYILDISDEIIEITKKDFRKLDYMKYEIFKGYEYIDDDNQKLISFKNDFKNGEMKLKIYIQKIIIIF